MVLNPISLYPQFRQQDRNTNNKHYLFPKKEQADAPFFWQQTARAVNPDLQVDINRVKNAANSIKKIVNDTDKFDLKSKNVQNVFYALSPIPTVRRMQSVPYSLEKGDTARAAGVAGLALLNLPQDITQLGLAWKEITSKAIITQQHKFDFFKGTFAEKLVPKNSWLNKIDKTLFDSKFLRKLFKINISDDVSLLNKGSSELYGYTFEGNAFQKFMGRTFMRIPVIGLLVSSALEIPALIKAATIKGSFSDKFKSFTSQLCKSASFVTIVNGAIAMAGAAFAPYGVAASLIGMAAGSFVGIEAAEKVSKQIDKIITA